jgi:tRNA dimethylallyltransferase
MKDVAFIALLGPTASGKSALGLALARRLGGEIVSCDSQQVYLGMDVGTAKPTRAERAEIPHHGLDVARPDEPFHAARWAALARAAIDDVAARGRIPIVVGGTGLYYRALTAGFFDAPPPDAAIRGRHREEAAALGVEALHARLAGIDPEAATAIGARDLVRISRALEVWEQTGVPITALRRGATPPGGFAPRALMLDPPLPELRRRIEARARAMFDAGFELEVRALRAAGYGAARPLQALGYPQVGAWLDGACTRHEAMEATISATVAYARRQRTWFRKESALARFEEVPTAVEALARLGAFAGERAAS